MANGEPWNQGVRGEPTLQLINSDAHTIRVEAGPGTGKTLGLRRRVLRIVHPDGLNVPGADVLIVAFNRVIAANLREEISKELAGLPETSQPIIRTVHGLCLEVVGTPLRLLMEHEREAMIYDVLCAHPEIASEYDNRHSTAQQALHLHEAHLEQHLRLWQAVQEWLTRHRAVLISDLPRLLLDKIKAGDYEGERYEHVIVDEFQDLTTGEQLLFMRLRRPGRFFAALGDSKQSIYRFRGNDPDGLRKLEALDPSVPVKDHCLPDCHRCPSKIVEAANHLMSLYPPPMGIANRDAANIHVVHWKTPESEAKGMAKHILANIKAHHDDRHLAMVTRKQFGYALRKELNALDDSISIDLSFSESLLEEWPVREAFLFFSLLVDPDPPTWRAWFAYRNPQNEGEGFKPAKRNADAYLKFLASHGDNISWDAVKALARGPVSAVKGAGGSILWARAKRLVELAGKFGVDPLSDDPVKVVDAVFDAERWEGGSEDSAPLDFGTLHAKSLLLLEEIPKRDDDPGRQLRELARRLRHLIATREPFEVDKDADLQITTLWGAKGVTAEHVYVLGICRAALPGTRRDEYPGTDAEFLEEQRRLFYVTLTRSRRTLVLSRAKAIRPNEGLKLGFGQLPRKSKDWSVLLASDFLRDIQELLPDSEDGAEWGGCC